MSIEYAVLVIYSGWTARRLDDSYWEKTDQMCGNVKAFLNLDSQETESSTAITV